MRYDGGVEPQFVFRPIGYVRSQYREGREIPKGLGAKHEAEGVLDILPELETGLTDIEGFSHLFVLWVFDRPSQRHAEKDAAREQGPAFASRMWGNSEFALMAHPPSDERPHGVFSTRSPRRPNPIGLTVVQVLRRDGPRLHVRGVDMLDGTPILDVKPYLSSVPDAALRRGWLAEAEARKK